MNARIDVAEVKAALHQDPARIARLLLGEENRELSTRRELRFGRRGSLALVTQAGPRCGLFHDHETGAGGDLLALIQRVHGCNFAAGLKIAAELVGTSPVNLAPRSRRPAEPERADAGPENCNAASALKIWHEATDARGTIVEEYLKGRGLELPPRHHDILRFHKKCPFFGEKVPAMIALMRDIGGDAPRAVHRTTLLPDGRDRDRDRGKAMLGPAKRAAVKLSPDEDLTLGLHVSEGIETALATLQFGLAPCWALGSSGAIGTFPVLGGIEALTIAVDHDAAGLKGTRACAARWTAAGREVRLVQSPKLGDDIADLAARKT